MRILIVEDDMASRRFLYKFLQRYGECDTAVDGVEGLDAFMSALGENRPYDLICLDIMMPKLDGLKVLKAIRDIELQKGINEENRVKIIMLTALNEVENVQEAFDLGCEAYASKPIDLVRFVLVLKKLKLIE